MQIEEEIEDFADDLCGDICNLSAALNNLQELDTDLISEARKKKLARMKRMIFDTLVLYVECLPQNLDNEENKDRSIADT